VDVVTDLEPGVSGGVSAGDIIPEDILGVLNQVGIVVLIVVGINVEVDNVVAEISKILLATRLRGAAGVGWAHVGGDLANDVAESHLVLDHLVVTILLGNGAKVQMGPGMRGQLVALGVHALEDIDKLLGDVDLTLVDIVTSDEERGMGVVGLHDIENVAGEILLWAIVVGDRNSSWGYAGVDAVATILD
jgi:hypothetical protein